MVEQLGKIKVASSRCTSYETIKDARQPAGRNRKREELGTGTCLIQAVRNGGEVNGVFWVILNRSTCGANSFQLSTDPARAASY